MKTKPSRKTGGSEMGPWVFAMKKKAAAKKKSGGDGTGPTNGDGHGPKKKPSAKKH